MRDVLIKQIDASPATQVILSNMEISDAEIEEVLDFIKSKKSNVEEIFLDNNLLSDAGAQKLGEAFGSFSRLAFVDLQFNKIGKKGTQALELMLAKLPIQLALCGNPDGGVADTIQATTIQSGFRMR